MIKKYLKLMIAAGMFFSSCKNGSGNKTANGTAVQQLTKDGKVQFALQLVQGAKYNYTSTTETTINLEVENKKVNTANNATIGLLYEVVHAANDSMVIKLTYSKIHIELINKDDKQVMDADNKGEEQTAIDKLLGDIKGSSLLVTLNNKGKVLKVTGSKEIMDKVLNGLSLYDDEQTKQTVRAQLGKLAGDDFIQNTVAGSFSFYPDTTILPGQSWSKKSSTKEAVQLDAVNRYTLASIDDGIANIDIESSFKSDGTNKPVNCDRRRNEGRAKSDGFLCRAVTTC
jgi:hypothetical protein